VERGDLFNIAHFSIKFQALCLAPGTQKFAAMKRHGLTGGRKPPVLYQRTTSQAAEKLDPEGGGGFNPRINRREAGVSTPAESQQKKCGL
jgi:hypothetical protein